LGLTCQNLQDGEFVIIEGPSRTLGRRTAWFGRSRPGQQMAMFAQGARIDNVLYLEVIGGTHVHGEFPWTDAEDVALRKLGWQAPPRKGVPLYMASFPANGETHREYLSGTLARDAAALVVRSLRDVGAVASPTALTLTRDAF